MAKWQSLILSTDFLIDWIQSCRVGIYHYYSTKYEKKKHISCSQSKSNRFNYGAKQTKTPWFTLEYDYINKSSVSKRQRWKMAQLQYQISRIFLFQIPYPMELRWKVRRFSVCNKSLQRIRVRMLMKGDTLKEIRIFVNVLKKLNIIWVWLILYGFIGLQISKKSLT